LQIILAGYKGTCLLHTKKLGVDGKAGSSIAMMTCVHGSMSRAMVAHRQHRTILGTHQSGADPMPNPSPISVEEHQVGGTTWIALRARNMIWIWLTPDEAVEIARAWIEKYSK
jgi:hypothetical protein